MKDKIDDKNIKKIKILIIVVVILLIIWFLVVSPLIKFKNSEKQVLEAAKRYYEINNSLLPTGKKIRTVSLQTLYDKDLISEDLKSPYTNKECNSKTSWAKVRKENNEYKYYVYLECGILSSKIDHKGPEITLKDGDTVTINKGDTYKDAGIKSVIDDTDGNIDIKKVTIDSSKVNTNKNGTYEVTYKVRDSFNNETVKIRTVKVEQILNKIVEKDTDKTNIYKGSNSGVAIRVDGIIFDVVGVNDDGSIKVVSNENVLFADYNSVDKVLDDFYNNLSDEVKEYIETNSKWCDEKVSDIANYKKCNDYSKKKPIGLLSVADINNSYDSDGISWITSAGEFWTSNSFNSKQISSSHSIGLADYSKDKIMGIRPTLNIKKNTKIISGTGTYNNPYIFEKIKQSVGSEISNLRIGEYINYSGYNWRVSSKDSDNNVKLVMTDVIGNPDNGVFETTYSSKNENYNPNSKNNIGYKINNEVSSYISGNNFMKHNVEVKNYKNKVSYDSDATSKTYKSRLSLISIFDYFSSNNNTVKYWYKEHTTNDEKTYVKIPNYGVDAEKYNNSNYAIKLVGYINGDYKIKMGDGTEDNPYTLSKK